MPDPAVVRRLFDTIEPSYDRFTRAFSFGMDARWKRAVRAARAAAPPGRHLDLATGTGDLLDGAGVGVDFSLGMLRAARRREGSRRLVAGDLLALPVATASAGVVTAAYALRNVADAGAALDEARRVLAPGGLLVTLDFYRPAQPLWRLLFLRYLWLSGGVAGWWLHRDATTYGYIARSLAPWHTMAGFEALLARHGFTVVTRRPYLGGGVAVHVSRAAGPR